jgi:cobalamin-dependent methionine synthase I
MAKKLIIATDTVKESDVIEQLNKRSGDNTTATATISAPRPQANATDTVETESLSPEQQSESAGLLHLTADQLNAAISAAVDTALAPVRSELQTAQDQLTEAQKQNSSLEALFKVIGKPASVAHSAARHGVAGLAADFMQACDSAPSASWINKRTGERIIQRDMS